MFIFLGDSPVSSLCVLSVHMSSVKTRIPMSELLEMYFGSEDSAETQASFQRSGLVYP